MTPDNYMGEVYSRVYCTVCQRHVFLMTSDIIIRVIYVIYLTVVQISEVYVEIFG